MKQKTEFSIEHHGRHYYLEFVSNTPMRKKKKISPSTKIIYDHAAIEYDIMQLEKLYKESIKD